LDEGSDLFLMATTTLNPDRYFSSDASTRNIARELYQTVASLPLICPHGHVDPRLFADPNATFGSPADLFIIPDHYVTRMLYSQGIPLESLGAPPSPAGRGVGGEGLDHRKIWKLYCENFYLFRGAPSGIWLTDELVTVFGVDEKPSASNADRLYDLIAEKLTFPDFSPRILFERFQIEVLCTTDAATDTLEPNLSSRWSRQSGCTQLACKHRQAE
jgi:glucuronate isomerase